MPTQLEDSVHHTSWRLPRACMRPGAPILKTRYAIFSISSEPLVECCFRYSEGGCRVPYRLRLLEDTAHHQFSRIRGRLGVTMQAHRVLPLRPLRSLNNPIQPQRSPVVNNLLRKHN